MAGSNKKRLALLLALAALFFGSIALLCVLDDNKAKQKAAQQQAQNLFVCDPNLPIVQAHLSGEQSSITLVRHVLATEPNTSDKKLSPWRLTAPIAALADTASVEAMTQSVCGLKAKRRLAPEPDEAALEAHEFGLMPPKHELTLHFLDGHVARLEAGDKAGFDNSLYIKVDDAFVLVDDALQFQLTRDVFAWRDKHILDVEAKNIVALSFRDLQHQENNFSFRRDNDQGTLISENHAATRVGVAADMTQANELLDVIGHLRAIKFVTEQSDAPTKKRFGLDAPTGTLDVTMDNGTTLSLEMGTVVLGQETRTFVTRAASSEAIAEISQDTLLTKLRQAHTSLRNMEVLGCSADAIEEILIEAPHNQAEPKRLTMHKKAFNSGFVWEVLSPATHDDAGNTPKPQALDSKKIESMLMRLCHMRADTVAYEQARSADLTDAGLTDAARHVALMGPKQQFMAGLWLGRSQNGQTLVTDEHKHKIWRVFDQAVAGLDVEPQVWGQEKNDPPAIDP